MTFRAGDVKAAYPHNHVGGGGSTPTPALHFQLGQEPDAGDLIRRFHYSRRYPANVQHVGTFHESGGLYGDCGPAVAACVFSIPPTRWSEPVLELSRLVRREGRQVPLSRLIKLTVVYVKRSGEFDLLVSFADWTQKHHGGVYQAACWNYGGLRERQMDGLMIEGKFLAGRSCNSRFGTRSPEKVAAIVGAQGTVAPHFDEGKYLYWKALNKTGEKRAKRLGLTCLPYPKPEVAAPARPAAGAGAETAGA